MEAKHVALVAAAATAGGTLIGWLLRPSCPRCPPEGDEDFLRARGVHRRSLLHDLTSIADDDFVQDAIYYVELPPEVLGAYSDEKFQRLVERMVRSSVNALVLRGLFERHDVAYRSASSR